MIIDYISKVFNAKSEINTIGNDTELLVFYFGRNNNKIKNWVNNKLIEYLRM